MAKKEPKINLWVAEQLKDCRIQFTQEGSDVKELNEALSAASKKKTGKVGYPDYTAVVGDFVIVIEDKADLSKHIKLTATGVIDTETKAIRDYAVNGAIFYAMHIAQHSSFMKVFAIGVSGDGKHHKITPYYVDDRGEYKALPNVESFTSFTMENIDEYYTHNVLGERTDVEKTTEQILKDAAELHEYLRTYGSLKDQDKPLVVSGILLALDDKLFHIEDLHGKDGSNEPTDGDLIYAAIQRRLKASNVGPDAKRDKLMSEFAIIKTSERLNTIDSSLGKTPLKYFTEFLKERVFKAIKYRSSVEDFIGRFYGEFMSYSGGDGQTLGIVLTPAHICELFCDILDIQPDDIVLDPCCGTAGFLVAAMHHMVSATGSDKTRQMQIRKKQLHGFEIQSNMFAIACTNMILRQDGNSNIRCEDFLKQNPAEVQQKGATVGMMNPPYSQGTKADPSQYEISFVEHLLDSLTVGARAAVIVPQSTMTGKTPAEQAIKDNIMLHHTLEGVITCNTQTFYGVGTNPVIAIFTAYQPHPASKLCKFIDFRDDGYRVHAHVGLVEEDDAKDKRQHLLNVWRGNVVAPTAFCVESTVKPSDEWLHSFYYFNDSIPTDANFERVIGDYLTFEFSMVMQNKKALFTKGSYGEYLRKRLAGMKYRSILALHEVSWGQFTLEDIFDITPGKRLEKRNMIAGEIPFIGASDSNNGVTAFVGNQNNPSKRKNDLAEDKKVLGVNYNGSVCVAFYHPYKCIFSDDVKRFHLKNRADSEYLMLFSSVIIRMQKDKYLYSYKFNERRMRRQIVMLPVTRSGNPNWKYMEQYVKNLIRLKYEQFLV